MRIEKIEPKTPQEKKPLLRSCCSVILRVLLVLIFLFLLGVAGIVLAFSATGIVKVPFLSDLFKPPVITEDFSYEPVSMLELDQKISLSKGIQTTDLTLTANEINTIIPALASTPQSPIRSASVRLEEGVVKVKGELIQNSVPFYIAAELRKESGKPLHLKIKKAWLGALPLPTFLLNPLIEKLLSSEDLSFLPDEITVKNGALELKGVKATP